MRAAPTRGLSVGVVLALTETAWSQTEPPLPPRILENQPGEAVLARIPENRREELEEIVVIGEERWRLPDLGAAWRLHNEPPRESRLSVGFLPLYDPESTGRLPDIFQYDRQRERTGFLELFRIRFGAQPERSNVPTVTNPNRR